MNRSVWKGPFVDKKIIKLKSDQQKPVRIWSRRSVIFPKHVGITFEIYNGKEFLSVTVTEDMIGHKFGEFAATRQLPKHKKTK